MARAQPLTAKPKHRIAPEMAQPLRTRPRVFTAHTPALPPLLVLSYCIKSLFLGSLITLDRKQSFPPPRPPPPRLLPLSSPLLLLLSSSRVSSTAPLKTLLVTLPVASPATPACWQESSIQLCHDEAFFLHHHHHSFLFLYLMFFLHHRAFISVSSCISVVAGKVVQYQKFLCCSVLL